MRKMNLRRKIFSPRNKTLPVFLFSVLCRIVWAPLLFMLPHDTFLPLAVSNVCVGISDALLCIFYSKLSRIKSLTIFTLTLVFFCCYEAYSTKLVCGMEYVICANMSAFFLFTTRNRVSKKYYLVMIGLLACALSYLIYVKLSSPALLTYYIPVNRRLTLVSQIFYMAASLIFLLYASIRTDDMLRKFSEKRNFLHDQLEYLAKHDPLTGLMDRRRTLDIFAQVAAHKKIDGTEYAICIFDIDDFKKVNDTWGHGAGDFILQSFTRAIWDLLPNPIKIGRWGGEEFVIIFPAIDSNTIYLLEDVRRQIVKHPVVYEGNTIPITATFGISSSRNAESPMEVLNDADAMLLTGKNSGKNRIVVSEQF